MPSLTALAAKVSPFENLAREFWPIVTCPSLADLVRQRGQQSSAKLEPLPHNHDGKKVRLSISSHQSTSLDRISFLWICGVLYPEWHAAGFPPSQNVGAQLLKNTHLC